MAALQAELAQTRQRLALSRQQYADLYRAVTQERLVAAEREAQIAALFVDTRRGADDTDWNRLLQELVRQRSAESQLREKLVTFRAALHTWLEVTGPSESLRSDVLSRFESLADAAQQAFREPSVVARRGGDKNPGVTECRVLAVHDDLTVVILDAGMDDGVRPGSVWIIQTGEGKSAVMASVIETRSSLSAAVLTSGSLGGVAPGQVARLQ